MLGGPGGVSLVTSASCSRSSEPTSPTIVTLSRVTPLPSLSWEIWGDVRRCTEIKGDLGSCREMYGDKGRCGRCREIWESSAAALALLVRVRDWVRVRVRVRVSRGTRRRTPARGVGWL